MSESELIRRLFAAVEKNTSLLDKVVNTLEKVDRRVKILEKEKN